MFPLSFQNGQNVNATNIQDHQQTMTDFNLSILLIAMPIMTALTLMFAWVRRSYMPCFVKTNNGEGITQQLPKDELASSTRTEDSYEDTRFDPQKCNRTDSWLFFPHYENLPKTETPTPDELQDEEDGSRSTEEVGK